MSALALHLLRRVAFAVAVLVVISFLVFAATAAVGGNAAVARLGPTAAPAEVERLRHELGLDRPWLVRYADWVGDAVRGDLGRSDVTGTAVGELVSSRGGNSLVLGLLAALVLVPTSVALGLWAGLRAGARPDRAVMAGASVLTATPEFVVGALLALLFAVRLGWLPAVSSFTGSPLANPAMLVLPVASLVTVSLGLSTRLVRAGVLEVARSDAVEAARLNGVGEGRIVWRWVLPAGVRPALPAFARNVAYLLGGTLVVETVFGYPGLASVLIQAVDDGDAPVVQGVALVAAAFTVGLNLVADVVTLLLDPVRRQALA